jgi:hypothetical protein
MPATFGADELDEDSSKLASHDPTSAGAASSSWLDVENCSPEMPSA